MSRVTLRERFFPLHQPAEVDRFLGGFSWCVIFKAGTSDKTFDAWLVAQQVLESRVDVAVGFIRLPEDRPASEHLAPAVGPRVRNEAVVTLEPYRVLLSEFLEGRLPEERFQWGFLDRLVKEAQWRDDETFALLNGLFENESGRDVTAARLVAVEFQGQLAGRLEPLKTRAARLLDRLSGR
jgi:hypothetical protein